MLYCTIKAKKYTNMIPTVEKNKVGTITKICNNIKKKKFVFINSGTNIIKRK